MREIIPTPPSSDPPLIVKTRQGCGFSARWLGTGVAGFIDVSGLLELERQKGAPRIYWHRELPPYDAQPMGEHIVEATSSPVPDTIARRDELWNRCRDDLMAKARERLTEEMVRLGDATPTSWTNRLRRGTTRPPVKPGLPVALPTCCTADELRSDSERRVTPQRAPIRSEGKQRGPFRADHG